MFWLIVIEIPQKSLFQSPLKGATIPYRPSPSHQQQHQSDDSCQLQQQQHFNSKGSPPPTQTSSSLSPTPPPSSTTSCSRTDSPVMTSYTHPMVVMTSPYLNGGGGGGGGLSALGGEGALSSSGPMCNGGMATYFPPAAAVNNNNNNNNHIPTATSLYHPPPSAPQLPTQSQMAAQSSHLSQPHLVKPFLNSFGNHGPPSAPHPLSSQYIYFPSSVPMSDPFAYSTLVSMGAGQPTISVTQSNMLAAAASGPPGVQPHFYATAPFTGLEHYMNYKNGHHLGALSSPLSSPPHPFLPSPVQQLNPERAMMYSSNVPDVSLE